MSPPYVVIIAIEVKILCEWCVQEDQSDVVHRCSSWFLCDINFFSFLIIIRALGLSISNFLSQELFHAGDITFLVSNLVNAIFIMVAAQSILWIINQTLLKYYETHLSDSIINI